MTEQSAWDGRTYYDEPQLRPAPFNNALVGSYIFFAGLSGAAQSSAVAAAAAALRLGEHDNRRRRDLDSIAVAALAVELAATLASDDAQRQAGIDEAPHGQTTLRTTAPLVLLLTSLLLPGRLGRTLSAVGSLALLGDGLAMRIRVLQRGDQSARQPHRSLRFAQPDNLPPR